MSEKMKNMTIVILLIILALVALLIVWMRPSIYLVGKDKLELNVGDTYKEKGYHASFMFKDVSSHVKVSSNIDVNKIGNYEVKYELKEKNYYALKIRKVSVVDKEAPKIELKGERKVSVCPDQKYEEEGYTATDNYDGDVTEKVKINISKDKISYKVSDKSKNEGFIERKIVYEDKEAPLLTLNGGDVTITVGSNYEELGYKAIDKCEGDITSKVVVSGEVNKDMVGEYKLNYKVEDNFGNVSDVTRTVKVVKQVLNGSGKTIYLTFDDGPSRTITPEVLKILREENVPATFFVINHDDSLNYLIKEENDEGHTVALHSFSHNYSYVYSSVSNYFEDLYAIQNKVEGIIGKKSTIIRFPGGSSNTVSRRYSLGIMTILTNEVTNKGFTYFDWNVSSGDAGEARSSDDVYRNVTSSLKYQNNVVLMHDFEGNYKTLNALRDIIKYGKQNGYTFSAINTSTFPSHHGINN